MKKQRKAKKVAPKGKSHRRNGGPDPKRLTRSAVARHLRISTSTVIHYMAKEGAPKPDGDNRYDPIEALKWCEAQSKWALAGTDPAGANLRTEKLQLEVAELRRQDGLRKGELFERSDWDDESNKFVTDVEGTYQKLFYHELPPKLVGKNEQEIRELIARYLLDAATALRESAKKVETTLTAHQA